jgi:diamine N-acetyltransferase
MKILEGSHIQLRALEPTDLDFLYELENDELVWEVSNTVTPYSKFVLKQYLENSHRDIYDVKQLRLVVSTLNDQQTIGLIDLFDFDPKHERAGIGIIILSEKDRGKGFAKEAIQLLCTYAFQHLNVHQLYANITEDNTSSIQLFKKLGFSEAGIKKDWILSKGKYKNEHLYQLIRS